MKFKLFKREDSHFREIAEIIFHFSLIIFLILLLIEYLVPGFATNWFNPIWFLIVAILSGIITTINN
jgi:hypothetical protein